MMRQAMTALIAIARCSRSAVRNSRNSTRQPDFRTRKKSSIAPALKIEADDLRSLLCGA